MLTYSVGENYDSRWLENVGLTLGFMFLTLEYMRIFLLEFVVLRNWQGCD